MPSGLFTHKILHSLSVVSSAHGLDLLIRANNHYASVETPEVTTSSTESASASAHLELGRRGEELAAAYLQKSGYRIVAANFSLPVGRNRVGALIHVEIDLVAYDGETLCFIEVKSRSSDWFAPPQANVDRRKQRQIARAARAYRRMFGLIGSAYRYDVVTVILPTQEKDTASWEIQLLRNYWTEDQLPKRMWSGAYYE
jgi:putative endonuclease